MKQYGALIALGVAVLCGIAAVVLVNRWLSSQSMQTVAAAQDSVPLTRIVVAAKDLEVGSRLDRDALALTEWPRNSVPKGAYEDIAELEGRVAVTRLVAGKPILAAELAAPGSGAGLVALITPGHRAMAVKVNEVIGVGGFILPETTVDVIGVDDRFRGQQHAQARTILKRIKVLAVAQQTFTEEGKAKVVRTVTLEVKPSEAEKLAAQLNDGGIHLVLRNPLDELEEAPPTVAAAPVRAVKTRPVRSAPDRYSVRVIRGGDVKKENVTAGDY